MRFIPVLLTLCIVFAACSQPQQNTVYTQKVLRHVVMFKFKDGTPPETVGAIEQAFAALPKQISFITDFEFGTNNSPESLNQGLTHCFLVSFASEKDRDTYITHPAHQAFVDQYAKLYVDKVTVLDYWAQK
jgi:Stress responsive A/B Barrel Domain